jgi:type I site-specific restriction endonuclease
VSPFFEEVVKCQLNKPSERNPTGQTTCSRRAIFISPTLDVPFVFSSNGDGFVFHDRTGQTATIESNLGLDAFPSPANLWARYRAWKGFDPEAEQIVLQDYFDDGSGKARAIIR